MYDIKQLKQLVESGAIAVNEPLRERMESDSLTEDDHAFLARTFGVMRDIKKGRIEIDL